MREATVRVALLARPGNARDQLRRALAEVGAELVAEGDPAELDPIAIAGENPGVVLVSLEAALEDSLARFEDLLAAPGIDVIYDDAEVTRQLDGWDLARWARHLAAKLVGSDLLPPAPGGADHLPEIELSLEPGAPRTPAQEMAGEKLEDYAAESLDLSEWVPSEPSLAVGEPPEMPETPDTATEMALDLDLDLGDLEQALGRMDAQLSPDAAIEAAGEPSLEFDPGLLDIDLSALPDEGAPMATLEDTTLSLDALDEPLLADLSLDDAPISFSSFSDDEPAMASHVDDDVAALAAQLDAYEGRDHQQAAAELNYRQAEPSDAVPVAAVPAAPVASGAGFGALELLPMDAGIEAPAPAQAAPTSAPPAPPRTSHLSLVGEGEGETETPAKPAAKGALLVIAGLGGPDAVRQLLSALPASLPLPVLLYQHLDTGKHDRLLGQLSKASGLPLDLAVEDKLAYPGRVGILSPGVGIEFTAGSLRFVGADSLVDVVLALPAADSAVLVLSGAEPAIVPSALMLRDGGALVLAQDPASCFDPVACHALIAAGCIAAPPSELARLVNERWP